MKLIPTFFLAGGLAVGSLSAAEDAEPANQVALTIVQAQGGG